MDATLNVDRKHDGTPGSDTNQGALTMTNLKRILMVVAVVIGLNLVLVVVNILQNGLGDRDGVTIESVMGKSPNDIVAEDLSQLSKEELMDLFWAAEAPEFSRLNGEYKAKVMSVGVLSPATSFITHHLFGPGKWVGKAFHPTQPDKGWGYNLFSAEDANGNHVIKRTRKMDTWMGISEIDGRESYHLVYQAHNSGIVESMHDEVRRVNDQLYICMGYMGIGGGSINPAPFILYDKPTDWIGLDED